MTSKLVGAFVGLLAFGTLSAASATTLFSDSFQDPSTSLNAWTVGGGEIVTAPTGGYALAFNRLWGGGDIFTNSGFTSSSNTFTVSFDIYGACGYTSQCGAFLYTSQPTSTNNGDWILSDTPYGIANFPDPVDAWEHVSFTFGATPGTVLSLEDWVDSSNAFPGSFYLRNFLLTDNPAGVPVDTLTVSGTVPEPSTWAMLLTGFAGLGLVGRRALRKSGAAEAKA